MKDPRLFGFCYSDITTKQKTVAENAVKNSGGLLFRVSMHSNDNTRKCGGLIRAAVNIPTPPPPPS